MNAVRVDGLTRRFGSFTALDRVDLQIPAGQSVAVLGPNGAGKTTLVEILEGFSEPTGGHVRVLDEDPVRAGRSWRARVGLVSQSTSLEQQATVEELLVVYARAYPHPRPAAEVLELVDLAPEAKTRIGTLSGGQQRRVDLALAIVGRPEILFLDEPTTGLDPQARRRCWAVVQDLAEGGTTVLLTTHYLDEADRLAERIVVLSCGRIVADSSPAALRSHGRGSAIRFPIPTGIPVEDLPVMLAENVNSDRVLQLHNADAMRVLPALLEWARLHRLDLGALQVGPPSLEDAYLALTGASDG